MRKSFFVFAIVFIVISMVSTAAFAYGSHGRGHSRAMPQPGYAFCTVERCETAYSHQHGVNWYCGRAGLRGDYAVCSVSGCTVKGLHEHDGEYYHHQNYGTGNGVGGGCYRR